MLPEEESGDDDESIGLHNVQNRIQLLFGKDYGVSVRSVGPDKVLAEDEGFALQMGIRTIVAIRLPLLFD
jgi:hypothetical protein